MGVKGQSYIHIFWNENIDTILQLREQLDSAEASIESLNAQIFALGSTDTIERMREQHENIITSLQQEQEKERNELNAQIAVMKSQLDQQVCYVSNPLNIGQTVGVSTFP